MLSKGQESLLGRGGLIGSFDAIPDKQRFVKPCLSAAVGRRLNAVDCGKEGILLG